MSGLLAYGAYVPHHRLRRSAIADALGTSGGAGSRTVASYDEDTTSMGVEAARAALAAQPARVRPRRLYFATASPAYADKTNATTIYAALGLDPGGLAVDMVGAVRSGVGALLAAESASEPTLAVLADVRTGLPGGADERTGGDAAVALLVGEGSAETPVLAEIVTAASATKEFLDRWREPGADHSRVWEERFGEREYVGLGDAAFGAALKQADLTPGDVDHLLVAGLHTRAVASFTRGSGIRPDARVDDLVTTVGNTGTAHPGLLLASVLDRAEPGARIVLVVLADGATAIVLRATDALPAGRPRLSVAEQVAAGNHDLAYADFLTWRGRLRREPPRRPDPDAYAAPPAARNGAWKFAFVAATCATCGTRHLPPGRVCRSCGSVDEMNAEPLSEVPATVATYTIDRLAFTPNPPLVAAVVDFDGGGRFKCQLTDVDPSAVSIGDRVELTFRRFLTGGNGVHNYFWKARPLRDSGRRDSGQRTSGLAPSTPTGEES